MFRNCLKIAFYNLLHRINQHGVSVAITLLLLSTATNVHGQIELHSEDLPRFYAAFDSVLTTADTAKQADFIQRLYVDKASSGLKEFMELRGGNTQTWRKYIEDNKEDLAKKRPQILAVLDQEPEILRKVALFKKYYPDFRDGDVYFCVGIGNSGGTIRDNTVYIGTEVAASDKPNWSVYLVLHEFTHTQQYEQRNFARLTGDMTLMKAYEDTHNQLLGQCIQEGMADFVAELVLEQKLAEYNPDGYIAFGLKHEPMVWKEFKKDMYLSRQEGIQKGWLYAKKEIDGQRISDLGYFMGYQICKSYYEKATDKKQALNYMIGLNLTDDNAKKFLLDSGYNGPRK